MDKATPLHLQDVIFSSSNPVISRAISKLEKAGEMMNMFTRINVAPQQLRADWA